MEKISENGAYKSLPMSVYHGDCCVGPSVSSTPLRAIETGSMRHGWLASHLNPNKDVDQASPYRIGSAVHSLCFEGELSKDWYAFSPFDSFRTNDAKAWRNRMVNGGKYVMTEKDRDLIYAIRDALVEEPAIQHVFDKDGEIETSLISLDAETGLWKKARPDVVPVNPILTDLKVVSDASRRAVEFSVLDYNYHMQLGLAAEVMEDVLGIKTEEYWLILVEKEPPHCVAFAEIDPDLIAWGRVLNRAAMRRFADCLSKGRDKKFFSKDLRDKEMLIKTPDWYHAKLTRRQEAGELPSVMEACGPFASF